MEFVVVDPKSKEHCQKVFEFCQDSQDRNFILEALQYIKTQNPTNNLIKEIAMLLTKTKVYHLCIIEKTNDDKLVKLQMTDLNQQKYCQEWITSLTNHALYDLKAETILVMCRKTNPFFEYLGYESLGKEQEINLYVKDREKILPIERKNI